MFLFLFLFIEVFGPVTCQMLTITGLQDVTVQFMVATKISQSDSIGTGTGTNERPVWWRE